MKHKFDESFDKTESFKGFELLPKGKYLCTVTLTAEDESKNTGREYLNVKLNIVDSDQNGNFSGRHIMDFLNYPKSDDPEKTANIFLAKIKGLFCAAFGRVVTAKELNSMEHSVLVGKTLVADVYHDDSTDTVRARVNAYASADSWKKSNVPPDAQVHL